ncbi:uncharacterized protein LOC129721626 [Wyeomyia smithii]|uniref:uncharacterized protein LOC129721626 n=1 Tax=Wyeomyia smithii TaxID=174621 RepID=UPI002467DA48|nr:uncharacterized protein LOC129721626 [Wyeomyia smithii]
MNYRSVTPTFKRCWNEKPQIMTRTIVAEQPNNKENSDVGCECDSTDMSDMDIEEERGGVNTEDLNVTDHNVADMDSYESDMEIESCEDQPKKCHAELPSKTTSSVKSFSNTVELNMTFSSEDEEEGYLRYEITELPAEEDHLTETPKFLHDENDDSDNINIKYLRLGNFGGKPCTTTSTARRATLVDMSQTVEPAHEMLRKYINNLERSARFAKENASEGKQFALAKTRQLFQRRVLHEKNGG